MILYGIQRITTIYIAVFLFTLLRRLLYPFISLLGVLLLLLISILFFPLIPIYLNKKIETKIINFFINTKSYNNKNWITLINNYKEITKIKLRGEILKNIEELNTSLLVDILNVEGDQKLRMIILKKLNPKLLREDQILQIILNENYISNEEYFFNKIPDEKLLSFKPENLLCLLHNLKNITVRQIFLNKVGIKRIV